MTLMAPMSMMTPMAVAELLHDSFAACCMIVGHALNPQYVSALRAEKKLEVHIYIYIYNYIYILSLYILVVAYFINTCYIYTIWVVQIYIYYIYIYIYIYVSSAALQVSKTMG